MVWFQCEDCGENLKKPKLPNHFRICSAFKFSCIDCGVTFGQESVQGHTQCITETEKYGPKGQAKAPNGSNAKPNKETKRQPDIDINVGLSERPPWFCSLCNTKATSQQTLLLHADGKKHRAKARAFHGNQNPKQTEESAQDNNVPTERTQNGELVENSSLEDPKLQNHSKGDPVNIDSEAANGNLQLKKKRKHESSNKDRNKNAGDDTSGETSNGEVIQVQREKIKVRESESKLKKAKHDVQKEDKAESGSNKDVKDTKAKLKWKKLITSALKSSPEGVLKIRKLRKLVLKALQESGLEEDEAQINDILERKITSSSRFVIDDKYVRLVAKD
ncbi:hypothetical protein SLA2020_189050 [Shorea laevis]